MKVNWIACLIVLLFDSFSQAGTIIFEDDFEGSLNPQWQGYLSDFHIVSDIAQHGEYSISTLRDIDKDIHFDLGNEQNNTTYSGWFYDNGDLIYEFLFSVANQFTYHSSVNMLSVGVDTKESQSHYSIFHGWNSHDLPMPRSIGWHRADIYANGLVNQIYIDGEWQEDTSFASQWRYIYLYANGWEGSQPDNPGYWDNVQVYTGPPMPIPEPATITLLITGLIASRLFLLRRK